MPSETRLPRLVYILGWISLFMDLSTEAMHSILPAFMVGVLGLSASEMGLVQGLGELTATLLQRLSGQLSDRWKNRRDLILLGYSLSALSKPLFACATGLGGLLFAQMSDRTGKGLRGAPRNAMLAAHVPAAQRGAAFGLRQGMDTVGALLGPVLMMLMLTQHLSVRLALGLCVIPALLCVLLIRVALPADPRPSPTVAPARPAAVASSPAFRRLLLITAGLSLARFSESFLILDLHDQGLALAHLPWLMVVMNGVYALLALPAGRLSDRWPRQRVLAASVLVLLCTELLLATSSSRAVLWLAAALWGVHLALSQGVLQALVADHSPAGQQGRAFGRYALVQGGALLLGNLALGELIDHAGWSLAMFSAALWAALTLLLIQRSSHLMQAPT